MWKAWIVTSNPQYVKYAAKMRQHIAGGTDLEVDARFVDMLARRGSTVLDIGCGHGSAVNGLRARGHAAYGIDPTPEVLDVAFENFDSEWFRELGVEGLSPQKLAELGIPNAYDVVLMAGNVPAFLPADGLRHAFIQVRALLKPGGFLVVGTSSRGKGGPADQDREANIACLALTHRFSDWHLGNYSGDSPWSVSIFMAPGEPLRSDTPDGMFILD